MGQEEQREKLTEQVKLLLGTRMLRQVQDLAMHRDITVSEYIRHVLKLHLYGHAALLPERVDDDRD